jgi:alanine racemase
MLEGPYQAEELTQYAELSLTPVLHAPWQIDALLAARLPEPLPVMLKINTGMNRLGFAADQFDAVLRRLEGAPSVAGITVLTHFADADEPRGIAEPLACFKSMMEGKCLPVSLANSAAILRFMPELDFPVEQWVRPGIMLYGASPFPAMKSAAEIGLLPVMTLESKLIAVRELQPGDAVGYGSSFVADRPMRVGVVACGYADGYPRHAPTGTPVMVAGQRTRTLGRVSMDKLCADLSALSADIGVGSKVILWGRDGDDYLPADDVATAAGTVAYELFCALAPRVPVIEID